MALPKEIAALIETFAANEADYTAPEFKEAQVRQQFIDPLFAALGWDVANTSGYAEAYKEVMHEDAIKIGGETKAPDYSFRIGGNRKFFVEAKKPSVLIKDHPEPAYQLRRYSWSAKLPLGILTDFQEFAIYDGRVKPIASDKASVARLFYCRYDELEKHWDFIAGTFSKEAVLKGSFDKYAATTKGKRGTTTVDDAFLEEIEKWRTLLARNLALRNPALDTRGLNFAVQRTIDRIVFLRIAEDRGNEPFGQLQALLGVVSANEDPVGGGTLEEEPAAYGGGKPKRPPTIYPRLVQIFEKADYRYNSGLFHFAKDADCAETPDTLTPALHIDDAVFKEILSSLYYPKSPYVFTVLPAYILGHVYEQFLGKVIRLTDGHRAEIEEKPEVRKAGGVYYTPQYIVDYIVQKTVGPLVEGKTPKQLETLAVLDPACGSGTFLLGAYDYLLKWYLDYYSNNESEDWAKGPSVAFKLPSKKQSSKILKQGPLAAGDVKKQKFARIYEIAPNTGKDAFGQPKVPTGNADTPKPVKSWSLTTEERKRILLTHIHGVDIDSQAVEVTKLSLLLKVLEGERREFQGSTVDLAAVLPDLSQNIRCGNSLIGHDFYQQPDLPTLDAEAKYKLNTFEWKDGFPEVMKRGGFDAVIGNPPYIFTRELFTEADREYFRRHYKLAEEKQNTYILFIEKSLSLARSSGLISMIVPNSWITVETTTKLRHELLEHLCSLLDLNYQVWPKVSLEPSIFVACKNINSADFDGAIIRSYEEFGAQLGVKVAKSSIKAPHYRLSHSDNSNTTKLVETISLNSAAIGSLFDVRTGLQAYEKGKGKPAQSAEDVKNHVYDRTHKADSTCYPYLEGRDTGRYQLSWSSMWMSWGPWLSQPRELLQFTRPRILIREITAPLPYRICATFTTAPYLSNKSTITILDNNDSEERLKCLLAVLNSRLMSFYYTQRAVKSARKLFPKIVINNLREFPIPKNIFDSKLSKNTDEMLALHRAQAAALTPHEKDALTKQITATDRQIDALVYQLYALTPEEIALVENT